MRVRDQQFRQQLLTDYELDKQQIARMSRNELFDYILEYEGHGRGSGYFIQNLVRAVFGIDLNHYRDYLPEDELRELEGWEE